MKLLAQIGSDLIKAQKSGDEVKISILRFLLAKIHDAQIAKGKNTPLTDGEIQIEIGREVKRHAESIEAFAKAKRADLAEKERLELEILENYLPGKLSQKEISHKVREAIAQTAATTAADFGKVMAAVMPKVGARAEGSLVAKIVRESLT